VTVGSRFLTHFSRLTAAFCLLSGGLLPAQQQAQQPVATGQPVTPAPADPAISKALTQVSPDNIKAIITKLVSFKNRSTLSSMDTDLPPGTGINAAADWIESEFKRYSEACGGCLEVKRDEFIEPAGTGPAARITKPTKLTNVYAILRGTDPAQAIATSSSPATTTPATQITSTLTIPRPAPTTTPAVPPSPSNPRASSAN
jgi:hypothetical protein